MIKIKHGAALANDDREATTWNDVVFIRDYEGARLSEVLMVWAEENEIHSEPYKFAGYCTCDFCQIFIPMAHKLETTISKGG